MNLDHLIDSLRELPEPIIEQVQDYVDFLKAKHAAEEETAEDRFWALIDLIDWDAETEGGMLEELISKLEGLEKERLHEFITQRADKLRSLDGPEFHAASATGNSADGFLYARCAVVAMGKKAFYEILKKPASFPQKRSLEKLLTCAEDAYLAKFGKESDFFPGILYESFLNDSLWGDGATFAKLGITPNEIREKATSR